jgi:hypothetical protein
LLEGLVDLRRGVSLVREFRNDGWH